MSLYLYISSFFSDKGAHNIVIAKKIKACFKGIDLTTQTFAVDGKYMEVDGCKKFYRVDQIDLAIKRINKLIHELNK